MGRQVLDMHLDTCNKEIQRASDEALLQQLNSIINPTGSQKLSNLYLHLLTPHCYSIAATAPGNCQYLGKQKENSGNASHSRNLLANIALSVNGQVWAAWPLSLHGEPGK